MLCVVEALEKHMFCVTEEGFFAQKVYGLKCTYTNGA